MDRPWQYNANWMHGVDPVEAELADDQARLLSQFEDGWLYLVASEFKATVGAPTSDGRLTLDGWGQTA